MVEDLTSLRLDYSNVMQYTIGNYSKAILDEALDSQLQTIMISNQEPSELMNLTVENPPEFIPDETNDSIPEIVIPTNQSPSAIMNFESLPLELLN